jgi:predicted phage tail protein
MTKVYLEGPLGKAFGREWTLAVHSPMHALKLINANKPGVFNWIRANLKKYARYRVVCEHENGNPTELNDETFKLDGKASAIRFAPVVEGAGGNGIGEFVAGAVILVAGLYSGGTAWAAYGPMMTAAGASLMVGGVAAMLAPKPGDSSSSGDNSNSTYFSGPTNTTTQGAPVPLIYGRNIMVGSQAISARLTVDQLLTTPNGSTNN